MADRADPRLRMLFVTDVLRPGAPRIGKLTDNIVFKRTLPLYPILAAAAGMLIALPFGLLVARLVGVFAGGQTSLWTVLTAVGIGGMVGATACQWQPWPRESVARVAFIRARALRATRKAICPGTGDLPEEDDSGAVGCGECGLLISPKDGLTPRHEWKRRMYAGMVPVRDAAFGAVRILPGNLPA